MHCVSTRPDRHLSAGHRAEIPTGVCIALYGRSGSGKSTLLNAIAGLEVYDKAPFGIAINAYMTCPMMNYALRARDIGIVYQSFNLLPTLTVREHLAAPELVGKPAERQRSWDY